MCVDCFCLLYAGVVLCCCQCCVLISLYLCFDVCSFIVVVVLSCGVIWLRFCVLVLGSEVGVGCGCVSVCVGVGCVSVVGLV